jgi:superfamily II DNA or RNA helicase
MDICIGATFDVTVSDDDERREIIEELTRVPETSTVVTAEPEPVCFVRSTEGARVALPRFYGIARFGAPTGCAVELREGAPLGPGAQFVGTLSERNRQREVTDAVLNAWRSDDIAEHGARITVPCGFGKTVVALYCVARQGRRALVVAPNTVLAEQWAERAAQFLPGARVAELGATMRGKSRHWLVPVRGPAPELITVTRRRTLGLGDVGRKITVRGANLRVRCKDPACRVEVSERSFCVFTDRETASDFQVQVMIEIDVKPPWEGASEHPEGCLLAFKKPASQKKVQDLGLGVPVPHALLAAPVAGVDAPQIDVVVATVQLLSMSPPPAAALTGCGVLVVDEVHSMCARVFSRALARAPCARVLALSATPERRDGLHDALPWLCGREVVRIKRAHEKVEVEACTYRPSLAPLPRELRFSGGNLRVADMITALCDDEERSRRIAREVAAVHAEGRCVLVLGERVAHLRDIAGYVAEQAGVECGLLCGETPKAERAAQCQRSVLMATYPMCRQGFDKARLDTLVMATPVTSLEQIVGRILRVHPEKAQPRVVDVIDPYSLFAGEYRKRARQYRDWGYTIAARPLMDDEDSISEAQS